MGLGVRRVCMYIPLGGKKITKIKSWTGCLAGGGVVVLISGREWAWPGYKNNRGMDDNEISVYWTYGRLNRTGYRASHHQSVCDTVPPSLSPPLLPQIVLSLTKSVRSTVHPYMALLNVAIESCCCCCCILYLSRRASVIFLIKQRVRNVAHLSFYFALSN